MKTNGNARRAGIKPHPHPNAPSRAAQALPLEGEGENGATGRPVATDVETFAAPWPVVLMEMKDYIDLWFLARSHERHAAAMRIFISKALVEQMRLQPHAREFKAAVSRVPCRVELRGTDEPAHRVEIDYRR